MAELKNTIVNGVLNVNGDLIASKISLRGDQGSILLGNGSAFAMGTNGKFLRSFNGHLEWVDNPNSWRPVIDNLTSTAADKSLSANQGKELKKLVDGKSDSGHTHKPSEVGAAAAHHLYHTWDNNTNYYDSFGGDNMFRIVTENMYADCFRFQASTVSNLEYYNGSSWASWNFDLSNLFDGNARTGVSIPYANRKFRFQLTANGGWPTTALFMLQGTWFDDGGWPNGQKSSIIIETRASTSDAWSQKASFDLSGVQGMAGHTLSSLHTGNILYRITIEIAPWTNTSNNCSLRRLCLFSNYDGGALETLSYTGTGNITTSKSISAGSFIENGKSLADKYLGINGTAKKSNYLISPSNVPTNANISDKENTNKAKLRVDLATSSMTTNKPVDDGFIYTNIWDINNSKNNNSQLYIPNGYHITNGRRLSVRGCKDDTWQTSWKELAYYSDIPTVNNPKITIKQGGTEKGSFTLNQSGGTTIELTDNNTKYSAGTGLSLNSSNNTFSVKTGYTTSGKNYKVTTDNSGNLYVNVPWTDYGSDVSALTSRMEYLISMNPSLPPVIDTNLVLSDTLSITNTTLLGQIYDTLTYEEVTPRRTICMSFKDTRSGKITLNFTASIYAESNGVTHYLLVSYFKDTNGIYKVYLGFRKDSGHFGHDAIKVEQYGTL